MNFVALDIAIGLIFVYFVLSLAVLAINEAIATLVNFRAQTLQSALLTLLQGTNNRARAAGSGTQTGTDAGSEQLVSGKHLRDKVYAHPLVDAIHERRIFRFGRSDHKRPSYIPPRTFVNALLDEISTLGQAQANAGAAPIIDPRNNVPDLRRAVRAANIPASLKRQIDLVVADAEGDMQRAKVALEKWFGDHMERVSATYKSRVQTIGFAVAVVLTLAVNADTIAISRSLIASPTKRAALVAQAQEMTRHTPNIDSSSASVAFDSLFHRAMASIDTVKSLGVAIGHRTRPATASMIPFYAGEIWRNLPGLLITALAVSLGAPFWFDMLNKVVNVRGAGRAPEERPKSPEAKPSARGA